MMLSFGGTGCNGSDESEQRRDRPERACRAQNWIKKKKTTSGSQKMRAQIASDEAPPSIAMAGAGAHKEGSEDQQWRFGSYMPVVLLLVLGDFIRGKSTTTTTTPTPPAHVDRLSCGALASWEHIWDDRARRRNAHTTRTRAF